MLKPLVPLGVFLAGNVGPPPAEAALRTYIMRMREQGWDTSALLAAFKRCGVQLSPQVIPKLELRKEMKEDGHVLLTPQVCLNSRLVKRDDGQVVSYALLLPPLGSLPPYFNVFKDTNNTLRPFAASSCKAFH